MPSASPEDASPEDASPEDASPEDAAPVGPSRRRRAFRLAARSYASQAREDWRVSVPALLLPGAANVVAGFGPPLVIAAVLERFEDGEGYDHLAGTVAFNLDLRVEPGRRVGLVGPSGGGKSTLTRLLLRVVDVDAGTVRIGGRDVARLRQADVRAQVAFVPQDPVMFHRSLRDNIAFGRPEATEDEIRAAAVTAHADDFIEALPEGYDTLVGERGVKLSGGQRQRLAIARAVLRDAPILVLDEATSSLDSASEALIQQALLGLMAHRTAIVIAHRLSTVRAMDRLIVLDRGAVVEDGTHGELLAAGGAYARLWHKQSGGFLGATPDGSSWDGPSPAGRGHASSSGDVAPAITAVTGDG